jgi:N-methylhydantoinase A
VPWGAGVASAIGLVTSELTVDEVRTHVLEGDEVTAAEVTAIFDGLVETGRAKLPPAATERLEIVRAVDMRARGQAHQLTVPLEHWPLSDGDLGLLADAFRALYHQTYGVDASGPVQLVNFRVRVIRLVDTYSPRAARAGAAREVPVIGKRDIYLAELGGFVSVPVVDWNELDPDVHVDGPLLVEGAETTVVVPPGFKAAVDEWRTIRLSPAG